MLPIDKVKLLTWPQIADSVLKAILLLIIIPLFVPFAPKMPAQGLDPSWALGLNQAVAQGLAFGRQIIFTLGPYSSIYTKAYHPSTDLMMMTGSLFLAFSYWFSLMLLIQPINWRWTCAFSLALLAMTYAKDSLFFSYPLLAGLIVFKIFYSNNYFLKENKYAPFFLALVFAPFGLLPLIKGTLLILCGVVIVLCGVLFTLYQKRILASICLAAPVISFLLFWLGAGQSIVNIPSYFLSSLTLASGFSEAMGNDGNNLEIILYLISSSAILLLIARQKQIPKIAKIFLLCLFFVFLFLSFKTGFTRHFGHAFICGTSILIAALLLPFFLKSKQMIPVIILSVYTATYIDGQYTHISITNNVLSTYSSTWHGLHQRFTNKNWLKQNFDVTMNFLRDKAAFPVFPGTTDIYPYDQTYLIASGTTWSPRPVFQSYSVFTPTLAEKNKQYLMSRHKPDTIIFKLASIDNRIPSLEDGASWPVLMKNYYPIHLANDFLFLRKKESPNKTTPLMHLLARETHHLGEQVAVPHHGKQLLFVELDIKPTVLGSLAITFFKPSELYAILELQNGSKKQFRIIANMAKSGFLLSPLVENINEFILLYDTENLLHPKEVKSLLITSNQDKTWQWHDDYVIRFKSLSNSK